MIGQKFWDIKPLYFLKFEELRAIFIKNGIDNLMLEYKHTGHWLVSPVYKKREKR